MLELLVAIGIIAMAAGALFWRLGALVDRGRFESDVLRFRSFLVTSRMLAFNTQSDWRLHAEQTAKGWDLLLACREDPSQQSVRSKLSPFKLQFNNQLLQEFDLEFYSSGRVSLKGDLVIIQDKKKSPLKRELKLPDIFHQEEGKTLGPAHPKDLEAT